MKALVMVFLLVLAACATPYQKVGFAGGFSETRLDDNVFQVIFKGNGYTSRERVSDFTLLRSAELALENGYQYFRVADSQNTVDTHYMQTPITAQTNTYGNTYGTLNTQGNYGSYNAFTNSNSTTTFSGGEIYQISKPNSANTIICYKKKPKNEGIVFDAAFIKESIRTKYELDKEAQQNKEG